MCYKKPGPRCSRHAKQDLEKATLNAAENPSVENLQSLQRAREDYDATPAGIKDLYQAIDATTDRDAKAPLFARLNQAKRGRALALHAYHQGNGDDAALKRQAASLFLPKGEQSPGVTFDDYFAATDSKHFARPGTNWEEKADALAAPSSQFDPYKVNGVGDVLGRMWAGSPEHLAGGSDTELFRSRGAVMEDQSFKRYLSAGVGGFGGVASMGELGDDYPVKMMEKVPGQPIIMFYVEGDKRWEGDGVVIVGRGAPKADNRQNLLGNLITMFPAEYPDDATGMLMFNAPPAERRAKNIEIWEKAKQAIKEDRLTVGVLRDEILGGKELRLPLAARPGTDKKDLFYSFMQQKLTHSPIESAEEYAAVKKDIDEAFGGCGCGSCVSCRRHGELTASPSPRVFKKGLGCPPIGSSQREGTLETPIMRYSGGKYQFFKFKEFSCREAPSSFPPMSQYRISNCSSYRGLLRAFALPLLLLTI